jgi:predicted negative regulator of RcsB-dependent stress response
MQYMIKTNPFTKENGKKGSLVVVVIVVDIFFVWSRWTRQEKSKTTTAYRMINNSHFNTEEIVK